jgi:ubiquinone/menaquinone biosynthesis C-methylase UbiE
LDDRELRSRYAQVFDAVAEDYDRARRTYPDELIDAACRRGGLGFDDRAVEVGCGTGHLTAALLERGLRVEAVDPGANMIRMADGRVNRPAAVRFHRATLEDVVLPAGAFAAVFSATAFHWVDPAVGWAKAASVLRPGGLLALIQYCDVWDQRTAAADEALLAATEAIEPPLAVSSSAARTSRSDVLRE